MAVFYDLSLRKQIIPVLDHQEIYKTVYDTAFKVGHILAHKGNTSVPLGDLLIVSRLLTYPNAFFLTLDKDDFSTVIFDRIHIVSIEKKVKNKSILEHIQVIEFNRQKFQSCMKELPE
jgi:hypothetical protein